MSTCAIISSTSRDLEAEIAAGRFREDLYHRLVVVPIRVPSLAERREDIPELIDYFMEQISLTTGLPRRTVGEDAMAVLQAHDWPGNVRQLRNNVERLLILAGGDPEATVNAEHAAAGGRRADADHAERLGRRAAHALPLREAREIFEREYLAGPDQPLRRQHLAHRRVRRHGALGAAPQAEDARNRLTARRLGHGCRRAAVPRLVWSALARHATVRGA